MKTENEIYIMSESDQLWRNELIKKMAKATRLPIPRVMMLTWTNFEKPNIIRTPTGRGVEIDSALALAIDRLPRQSKWMFSMTPFPPLIPDEYLDPAREYIQGQKRRLKLGIF